MEIVLGLQSWNIIFNKFSSWSGFFL